MAVDSSTPLIHRQISKIMSEVAAIGKNRTNSQGAFGFKFRGIDDIYNELHGLLSKHGVFTIPSVLQRTSTERVSSKGSPIYHVVLKIQYDFCAEDGSFLSTVLYGEAMDSGDKATNKAMSIAHKYAFLQIFAIPTEEQKDPDYDAHSVLPSPVAPLPSISPNYPPIAKGSSGNVSTGQLKRLHAILGSRSGAGWSKEGLKTYCRKLFGIESSKDLTLDQYDFLIDTVENWSFDETVSKLEGKTNAGYEQKQGEAGFLQETRYFGGPDDEPGEEHA